MGWLLFFIFDWLENVFGLEIGCLRFLEYFWDILIQKQVKFWVFDIYKLKTRFQWLKNIIDDDILFA